MSLTDSLNNGPVDRKKILGKIADLIESQGIDIEEIGQITRISLYEQGYKDAEGNGQVQTLAGVQIDPSWKTGPQWPVIQPGPAVKLPPPDVKVWRKEAWERCVILPDIQGGYLRTNYGLEPTHDEACLDLSVEFVRKTKPSLIVLLGDNLDLPDFTKKYLVTPAFRYTTQDTIDRMTLYIAQLRAAAPEARIVWLAGNHEERMSKYLIANAEAAFGLRQGRLEEEPPDSWPVLSVPFLCRMDEFGVEYVPGYPASHFWITPKFKAVHGDLISSRNRTADKYLDREKVSHVFGHIHRREWSEMTREDHDGPSTILSVSPGCLARIDGAVPSTKQGLDLDGRPVVRHENWQQGMALVEFNTEDGRFVYEQIPIHQDPVDQYYWMRHDGVEFTSPYREYQML